MSLHKEELVLLNNPEMDSIKGGTNSAITPVVQTISISPVSYPLISEITDYIIGSDGSDGSEGSEGSDGSDDMGDISTVQDPDYGGCLLPEIEVTP